MKVASRARVNFASPSISAFQSFSFSLGHAVMFLEARFETLQIYRNPGLRAFRGCPEILDRPRDWLLQFSSRSQCPIRIAQKLARHDHCIRLFRPNDVFRLNWRSDHSDRSGHDFGFAANTFGKGHLVTRTDRNFRVGHVTTGRTVDEINSYLLQFPGEFDRLLNIPTA